MIAAMTVKKIIAQATAAQTTITIAAMTKATKRQKQELFVQMAMAATMIALLIVQMTRLLTILQLALALALLLQLALALALLLQLALTLALVVMATTMMTL